MSNSKSLHNFSLPQLKWAQSNHRLRRRSTQDSHNNLLFTTVATPPSPAPAPHSNFPDNSQKPLSFSSVPKQEKSHDGLDVEKEKKEDDSEVDDFRHWKLRPRKTERNCGVKMLLKTAARQKKRGYASSKSTRLRGSMSMAVDARQDLGQGLQNGSERQRKMSGEKNRLWISLSREEIEEDVYSLTGSRLARRAKTRSKIVQKQLDHVFPGLYLVGMTVDYYRLLVTKATKAELQAINC